jgi:23S rRNA pseudouridine1911/1915/1917 synthase
MRADAFLSLALPCLSRTRIRQKIQMGESLLNGRRYASSARLRPGDQISIQWRSAPPTDPLPELSVLYEEELLLAVDKPAGVASHPMGRIQTGTIIQSARIRCAPAIQESLKRGDDCFYPNLVNRLDVYTSGIVLMAKTRQVLLAMLRLTASRRLAKEYVALVEGVIAEEQGRIELPLGRDMQSATRVRMATREDGLPCVTEFRVRRRLPAHTLLSVFPLTGRQHQIRAHMAAIGHPVVGDLLYKDERLFIRYQDNGGRLDGTLPARHCLHAERMAFIHPVTGTEVTITAPAPADFLEMIAVVESAFD